MSEHPKITRMLLEDVIKTYWDGYYPLFKNEPLICKEHKCPAYSIAWLAKHMRKEHNIYIARGDTKRQLYHTKDLLPGS